MNKEEMTIILNELQRLENISNATESSMILKRKHLENELLKKQNKQLKEVIEEVREYANDRLFDDYTYCSYEDVKQNINEILDKAKE